MAHLCHRNPSGSLLGCLLLSVAYEKHEYESYESHPPYVQHLYSCGGLAFCCSQPLWQLSVAIHGPSRLPGGLLPTAQSHPQVHRCYKTSLPTADLGPELLCCSNAGCLLLGFPWGHSHLFLNTVSCASGDLSIIVSGGVKGDILAVLSDRMYPTGTV